MVFILLYPSIILSPIIDIDNINNYGFLFFHQYHDTIGFRFKNEYEPSSIW